MDIIQKQTDIDCNVLTNLILKKEPEIIEKYPPTGFDGDDGVVKPFIVLINISLAG